MCPLVPKPYLLVYAVYAVYAHAALSLANPINDIRAPTQPSLSMPSSEAQCIANGLYAVSTTVVRHQVASSSLVASLLAPSFSRLSSRARNGLS